MSREHAISIDGVEYRRAGCCSPVPGDDVFGFVSRAHAISVHKASCLNAGDLLKHRDRIIVLEWNEADPPAALTIPVLMHVLCSDRFGMLKEITSAIGEQKSNIRKIAVTVAGGEAVVDLTADVTGREHLAAMRRSLMNIRGVSGISFAGDGDEFREKVFEDRHDQAALGVLRPVIIQVNRQLVRLANEKPGILLDLTPRVFEEFVAELFDGFGYKVELTAKTRDGGRDIVAIRRHDDVLLKYLIECKFYLPPNSVGVGHVRQLFGVKNDESASKAIIATTSYFTAPARAFEQRHIYELELKDYEGVIDWVRRYNQLPAFPGGR